MTGESHFELAQLRAAQEADAGIARIRAALERPGQLICDCGEEISQARRQALPNADKCIRCATFLERQARRRRA